MKEEVKHPSRYNQGGIEFWDVERAFFGLDSHIDHLVQSALEYGVRFRRKNGAEDLRKGANLLNVAADLLDGKTAKDDPVEKTCTSKKMNTPLINDFCYAIILADDDWEPGYIVSCHDTDCRGHSYPHGLSPKTPEEAVAQWNRRAKE